MKLFRTSRKRPDTTVRRATCLGIEYLEDRTTPAVSWLGGTGLWRDANQWSSGSVPTAADDVSIAGSGSLVTLTGSAAGKVLDLGGSGASPILALGGSSLGIASATIESGANLFLDGGTLGARGPLAFTAPVATAISAANDILVADLNGDGHADLALADRANGLIHFLFSNGNGTFTEGVLEPPFAPTHLAFGDVTGDGLPDLIAVGDGPLGSTLIGVFVGDGAGGFAVPPVDVPVSALGATSVAVGDFTGDGKADIALGIGVASQVILLTNTSIGGTLSFGQSNVSTGGPFLKSLVAADIDSDGKLDLIGAASGDRVVVLRQSGGGAFDRSDYAAAPGLMRVAAADLNGDGKLDLIAISDGGTAANPVSVAGIFPNAGGGAFGARIDLDLGANLFADHLAVGDWNGDGRPDVAVNTTAGLALIENLGGGAYPVTILGTGAQFAIASGDVNGDGKDDLVSVAGSAGNLSAEVWTNVHARGLVENQGRLFGPGVIAGNFTQAAGGVLELTAFSATVYDALTVEGSATLGGTLRLTLGYTPTAGTSFTLVSAGTIAGTFSTVSVVNLPSDLTARTIYSSGGVAIAFDAASPGGLLEISAAFANGFNSILAAHLPDLAVKLNGDGTYLPVLPATFTNGLTAALTSLLPMVSAASGSDNAATYAETLRNTFHFTSVSVDPNAAIPIQATITLAIAEVSGFETGFVLPFLPGIPGTLSWKTIGGSATFTVGIDSSGFFVNTGTGLNLPVALSFAADPLDIVANHLKLTEAKGSFDASFGATLGDPAGSPVHPTTTYANGAFATRNGDIATLDVSSVKATLTVPGLKFTSPPTTENSDANANAKIELSGHIGKTSGWGISFTASDHIFTLDKFQVSKLSLGISGTFNSISDIKVTAEGEIKVNPDGATNGDITLGLKGSIGGNGFSITGTVGVDDRTVALGSLGLQLKNIALSATFGLTDWQTPHFDASLKLGPNSDPTSPPPPGSPPPPPSSIELFRKGATDSDRTTIASATDIAGALDSTGHFTFHAGQAELHVGNLLSFSVAGLAIEAGPNLPADTQVFHLNSATASLDFLSQALGGAPTAAISQLTFRADGAFSLGGVSVTLPAGYTSRLGIAEFLPFELDSIALTFPNAGSFDAFGVSVTGQFNIGEMTKTFGFTPIISVGSDTINGKFSAAVNVTSIKQGKIQLQQFGPIHLGFSGLQIGVVTLSGALTLGGIVDSKLVTTASLDVTVESTDALGGFSDAGGVSIDSFALHADGSYVRNDVAGTISLNLATDVQVGLHAKLANVFQLDNIGFQSHLSLTAPIAPAATSRPTFELGLDGINVGHVSVGFGDYVKLSADNVVFNFSKEPGTALATIGTASLSFGLPTDSLSPLGITGTISDLKITQKGLPQLNGLGVNLSFQQGIDGVFSWFPVRVDKLGLKIGDMFLEDADRNPIGVKNLANFTVIFSGGFDGSKVAPGGQPILPLVATIQDVVLSVEKLSKGQFPIENLGGVSFGVLPFDLGPVRIGGLFSFGSVTDAAGATVYFGRLVGEFDYEGLGAGIDVVISDRGPVLATLNIPLGIPLDPFGIMLLSGASGSLTFGVTQIVTPSQPEDIGNLTAPTTTITDAVIKAQLARLQPQQYTWNQSIAIALKGTVITPYAPGVVSGDLTIGAYLGTQFLTPAGGLKFFAVGNLRVLGLSFASVKLLADFGQILEPVLAGLIQVPDPSNPLGFLFPAKGTAGTFASFKGVVPAYLTAIGAFVDTLVDGTASEAETFFHNSLDMVVARLRQDYDRPLSKLIFGTLDDLGRAAKNRLSPVELKTFFIARVHELLPSATKLLTNAPTLDELEQGLKLATAVVGEVLYTAGKLLERPLGIAALGDLTNLISSFSREVRDLFTSDSQRVMLAFSKVLQDAVKSSSDALVEQLMTNFDPQFLIRGKIQPVIFGLPIGQPPIDGEVTLDKRSLGVGLKLHVPIRALLSLVPVIGPSLGTAPFPFPELTFDGTFKLNYPYGDVIADALINGIPPIDPNAGNWSAKLEGGLSFGPLTLLRTGALMFPANWSFLDANVQKLFGPDANNSISTDRVQVGSQAHYDALNTYGGFLAYSSLTLPEFITDPVAAFNGVGAPPSDPLAILDWLSSIRDALQSEKEVGRAQFFLPSLSSVLQFNLVDFGKLVAGDPGGLKPKIGLADGKTPQDVADILHKAYLEGVLNGKLLGIEFANARMEADLTHLLIRGNISWLGNASVLFSLGSRQQDVTTGVPTTLKVPTVEARLDLDTTANLLPALRAWGINPDVFLPTATATFRAYSPAFDTSSTEVLKRTGGLQLETHLRLPGLVDDAAFKFDLSPPTAGKIIPQFTATATVTQFTGLFSTVGGLKIDSANLTLSNQTGTVRLTVAGSGTLLGQTVVISGELNGDLTGSLTVTVSGTTSVLGLVDGFSLSGSYTLVITRLAGTLQARIDFIGTVSPPRWFGSGSFSVSGSFGTDGSMNLTLSLPPEGYAIGTGSAAIQLVQLGNTPLFRLVRTAGESGVLTEEVNGQLNLNVGGRQTGIPLLGISGSISSLGSGSLNVTFGSGLNLGGFTVLGRATLAFKLTGNATTYAIAVTGTLSIPGLISNANVSGLMDQNGIQLLTVTLASGTGLALGPVPLTTGLKLSLKKVTTGGYSFHVEARSSLLKVFTDAALTGDFDKNGYGSMAVSLASFDGFLGLLTVKAAAFAVGRDANGVYLSTGGKVAFLGDNYTLSGAFRLSTRSATANPLLALDGSVSFTRITSPSSAYALVWGGWSISGTTTLSVLNGIATVALTNGSLKIPFVSQAAQLNGNLTLGGGGRLTVSLGDGLHFGGLDLNGTFALVADTTTGKPVVSLSATGAQLVWRGTPLVSVPTFAMDGAGNFDVAVVGGTVRIGPATGPAASFTFPSGRLVSNISKKTFALSLSPPTLTFPVGNRTVTATFGVPIDVALGSGNFRAALPPANLNVGDLIKLSGQLVLSRQDGVFHIRLEGIGGQTPTLSLFNLITATVNNFEIGTDGKFSLRANLPRIGPSFLGIENASLDLSVAPKAGGPAVNLTLSGGKLVFPTGDGQSLPTLTFAGDGGSYTGVVQVDRLTLGSGVFIGAASYDLKVTAGKLAVSLKSSIPVAFLNSRVTVRSLEVATDGNFKGSGVWDLTLGTFSLGSGSFALGYSNGQATFDGTATFHLLKNTITLSGRVNANGSYELSGTTTVQLFKDNAIANASLTISVSIAKKVGSTSVDFSGKVSGSLTLLGTVYYLKDFAFNSNGTFSYGGSNFQL